MFLFSDGCLLWIARENSKNFDNVMKVHTQTIGYAVSNQHLLCSLKLC